MKNNIELPVANTIVGHPYIVFGSEYSPDDNSWEPALDSNGYSVYNEKGMVDKNKK